MHRKTTTNRREALAFASLATALIIGGKTEVRPAGVGKATRPSAEELARVRRIFGGELGGFKGAR